MRIVYTGELGFGVTAKDLILGTIGRMGVSGGQGYAIEFAGPPIEALTMEGRMTVCNMTIEGGGRAGMIAPDETTFEWLQGTARGARGGVRPSGASCTPRRARAFDQRAARRRERAVARRSPGARRPRWSRR